MRNRVMALMVPVLVMGLMAAPGAAAPTPTPPDELQFFNISLRLVNASTYSETGLNWQAGFSRMAEYPNLADVITVLEVPLPKRDDVLKVIEAKLGVDYGWVHSDSAIAACADRNLAEKRRRNECGNTMIAFRTDPEGPPLDGLAKRCEGCGVKRWAPFNQQDEQRTCAQRGNETHVMARLLDRAQNKIVTVVPVHFDPGLDADCLSRNIKKLNDLLEADVAWRNRPMTVVVGDFNKHPDPRYGDASTKPSWRRETEKTCWYKRFSLQVDEAGCDSDIWGDTSLPYSEAIGLRNGTGTDAICRHWTFNNNKFGEISRAEADDCDTPNDPQRRRIDHLWVRYERSDGTAITEASDPWWQAQIPEAGVDRGWYRSSTGRQLVYSDHRMLHARLSWCGAQAGGYDTPCS